MNYLCRYIYLIVIFSLTPFGIANIIAQHLEFEDFVEDKIIFESDTFRLHIILGHPLCRSCVEQVAQIWNDDDLEYSIHLSTFKTEDIRSKRLNAKYFQKYFADKIKISFIDKEYFKSDVAKENTLRFPFFVIVKGDHIYYVGYNDLFDENSILRFDKDDLMKVVK